MSSFPHRASVCEYNCVHALSEVISKRHEQQQMKSEKIQPTQADRFNYVCERLQSRIEFAPN